MKILIIVLLLLSVDVFAEEKTPSDVYAESVVLKSMVIELRKEHNIYDKLDEVEKQKNKSPRHVLQKTLEILSKVNKYREINDFGKITLPPVPPRDITPEDVYENVIRLKIEVAHLLKNKKILKEERFIPKKYTNKTPSDVYRELWGISLAFDKMLGQGFTPTDVYIQTEQIIEVIKFLASTQREQVNIQKPKRKEHQHPNHALYKSIELLNKINKIQKKLWMEPVPIPDVKQKIISPTEVYDSIQTLTAELNRISRRLGVERSFKLKEIKEKKTPADVVQNLEYAISILPSFELGKKLNQYPKSTLKKTPDDVYALSEYILNKIESIKILKGIKLKAKKTTYIYGLKPIHVYVKGVENLEKISKFKELEGFKPSQSPSDPSTAITPSEVYELIIRLDDELNLVSQHIFSKENKYSLESYRELLNKKHYSDKTSSDVYDNLWKISYELDTLLNIDYTPNETFVLAEKIQNDIQKLTNYFLKDTKKLSMKTTTSKKPSDVFKESLKLLESLQKIKDRGNLVSVKTIIQKDETITPTSVYNALRIVSATISEIRVYYGIEPSVYSIAVVKNKTPSDVYSVVELANRTISLVLEDSSYED